MLSQREVILVGLGKFGESVSNNLVHIIEERRVQLGKIANSVVLHTVNFESRDVFYSTEYMDRILETIKDSSARKNNEPFCFIFVGDLFESSTSKYAIDFAYLPYLMQQKGIALNFNSIIGFFTFADELGAVEKAPDENLAFIYKFFNNLEKINNDNSYSAPYVDVNGKPFKKIDSVSGPFNRDYVLVTPGKSTAVQNETGIVFAERIFYELFYLAKRMSENSHNYIAEINDRENSDKNLSCFSMVQIPRINEVQKYYLKYLFEEKIVSSFLKEPIKGTDLEYYLSKFFGMIDIPSNTDEFPMKRAVALFINRYKENFSRILNYYVSGSYSDFNRYIDDCKKRLESTVFDMISCYDSFAHEELDYLFVTLKAGFENLFKVDRVNGNFKTYITFIEALKNKFQNWEASLKNQSDNSELHDIEGELRDAGKKIEKLQKNKLLSFFPLRPIRQKLIENSILSLPVEEYLDSLITQKLSKSFYEYWISLENDGKSPVFECGQVLENLRNLEKAFEDKEKYLLNKIHFIETMNDSYYILPMFEVSDDYSKLLERIKNRNFGSHNLQKIKDCVSSALKQWISGKDIFAITQNPTEFISFIENKFISENKKIFSETEDKTDEFYDFSRRAVEESKYKTENINAISFETSGTSLFKNEIMLVPGNLAEDCLSEEINKKFDSSLEKLEIPKDFTLGGVVYFKDYLYMSQKDMKKKVFLENYKDIKTSELKYDAFVAEKIEIDEKNALAEKTEDVKEAETKNQNLWKFTRSILLFYIEQEKVVELYNKTFEADKENLSDEEIDNLAAKISFEDALSEVSEEKLAEFAKESNIPVKSSKEKQIKLILHEFLEGQL